MIEYRCKFCHKLLFTHQGLVNKEDWYQIVVKCPKCKKVNTLLISALENRAMAIKKYCKEIDAVLGKGFTH